MLVQAFSTSDFFIQDPLGISTLLVEKSSLDKDLGEHRHAGD